MEQQTLVWRIRSIEFNNNDLETTIRNLISKNNIINCVIPLTYDGSVDMSTDIKKALIVYTPTI